MDHHQAYDGSTTSPPAKIIRNLLCHLYPVKGRGVWQANVAQLLLRMDQFNGQRIVSVVTDATTDTPAAVKQAFQGQVRDFLEFKNDPTLGEVVAFEQLLKRVENVDPRAATYYCHGKGVKYRPGEQPMVGRWMEVMHASLLDYPELVLDKLQDHAFAGSFLKTGNTFQGLQPSWHYAGTFFWFKNSVVFNTHWNRIVRHWWGAEAWPGTVCPQDQAAVLFHRGSVPDMKPYNRGYWARVVDPAWRAWQEVNAGLRTHHSYTEVRAYLKATNARQVMVTGPQRSGTLLASKALAADLGLPLIEEKAYGVHDYHRFHVLAARPGVIHAPAMSVHAHLAPGAVVWLRRNLRDVLRSQERVNWTAQHERQERDKYHDGGVEPVAAVKARVWETSQRIALGARAVDLDYETLRAHPLWLDRERRAGVAVRQTK